MVVSGDRLLCTETDKYTDIAYEYNEPPPEAVGRAQMDLLGTEEGQANVHKMLLIGDVSALSRSRRTARVTPYPQQLLRCRFVCVRYNTTPVLVTGMPDAGAEARGVEGAAGGGDEGEHGSDQGHGRSGCIGGGSRCGSEIAYGDGRYWHSLRRKRV
eukprot:3941068-Rhodomonas_salina.3